MRVLLLIPPMADLNTPYPSTAALTGHLRSIGVDAHQADWSLELAHRLLSRSGLQRVGHAVGQCQPVGPRDLQNRTHFLTHLDRYLDTVEPVMSYLQTKDPAVGVHLNERGYLPEGARLRQLFDDHCPIPGMPHNVASLEDGERAQLAASYYLLDITDVIALVDPGFALYSFADHVGTATAFDAVHRFLEEQRETPTNQLIREITLDGLATHEPDVVGLSAPFPGNVAGAFRIAEVIKRERPDVHVALGGGYVNTYLRAISDPRLFDYFDFVTLDDGERPLSCLLEYLRNERGPEGLFRTFRRVDGKVSYHSSRNEQDVPFAEANTPVYDGLPIERYISVLTSATPAHRIWSKRWNKLTLAHGCYWRKCSFCDTTLDYIRRYEPQTADRLIEHIEQLRAETGLSGFHWVDEAAPPALLRMLSARLLERDLSISWWGNIRFEKSFTRELTELMARAGCVLVSGGLEVASDRLLEKMKKGVSVTQVARVARHFSEHGIVVHAYLMYGFPTETLQETIDSLEYVRQLFAAGCLQSGNWHRFVTTRHSPVGQNPEEYGIQLTGVLQGDHVFTEFSLPFHDPTGTDHDALGKGLRDATYRFQEGDGLGLDVREWFAHAVPRTTVPPDYIARALATEEHRS